jgi:hypothetical protein
MVSTVSSGSHSHWHGWTQRHHLHARHRVAATRSRAPTTLDIHERILTRAQLADGGEAVGTDRAVHTRGTDSAWRRIGWIDIASAAWSSAASATVLRLWPIGQNASIVLELPTGRSFAAFAAERVSATQVLSRHVQLTPTTTAHVTALHEAGDDHVIWTIRLDTGCEQHDPLVAAAAAAILKQLRALAGC